MIRREIFIYWHQGFEAAPAVPKHCLRQIRRMHPGATIHALDNSNLGSIRQHIPLDEAIWERLSLPHKSDLLRTALLIRDGGVWMDPTVFPRTDMLDWLADKMDAGVFFFRNAGRDRIISNWFMAAQPGHPILIALMDRLCQYHATQDWDVQDRPPGWAFNTLSRIVNRDPRLTRVWFWQPVRYFVPRAPYMIYHYTLYDLLCRDPKLRQLWNRMPVVSAELPHILQRIGLQAPMSEAAAEVIADPDIPLFKLTWKLPEPHVPEGSVLHRLFDAPQRAR